MVVLTGFTGFHIRLILTNYTTLEYCEKRRENVSTWQISPYASPNASYNISLKLGFDWFIWWLIPVAPTKARGDGFSFKIYNQVAPGQSQSDKAGSSENEDKNI